MSSNNINLTPADNSTGPRISGPTEGFVFANHLNQTTGQVICGKPANVDWSGTHSNIVKLPQDSSQPPLHPSLINANASIGSDTFPASTDKQTSNMPLVTMNAHSTQPLKEAGIITDVIQDFTPATLIGGKFAKGGDIAMGNTLAINDTQEPPQIEFAGDREGAVYTVILTDPDAPSRQDPKWREFRHWVVTNVPSNGDVSKGTTIQDYMGPAPPKGTGPHRYVLLLYRQSGAFTEVPKLSEKRQNWKASTFAQQHEMTLVAANWFVAENKE
ncbi:hypothetical protein BZG36_01648 [Bifiguratus adelaidae]|uniref:Phosphatidylethanolamine-binding protein n=1 Tax=Bifiguratus adelaidae TaxID=1938954 RepID=A0A261Y492_9FUNG|nr:hypothetical protein BZG36_01648 [Bifiguratus adelaidae]